MAVIEKLNKKMLNAIEFIIKNPTASYQEIADEIGTHKQTVYNWYNSPVFKEALDKRLKEVWHDAVKIAQKTIIKAAENGNLDASKYICNSNGFNVQQIEVNTNTIKVTIDND